MYVKTDGNGNILRFPYYKKYFLEDNPNTSFPKIITDELYASYNVYPVVNGPNPDVPDYINYNVEQEDVPVLENGSWILHYTVVEKTEEEKEEFNTSVAFSNRYRRDELMTKTDWWALPDSPEMTAEQSEYRQALRDITTHPNWPHLGDDDWPTKP